MIEELGRVLGITADSNVIFLNDEGASEGVGKDIGSEGRRGGVGLSLGLVPVDCW